MALTVSTAKSPQTYEYVPLIERGEKNPFTVTVRRLTPKEFSFIEDKMARINQDQSVSFTTGTFNWEIVKKGIVGWTNLLDEDGKEVKPVKVEGGIADSSLNLLPMDIITELANVIVGLTKDPDNAHLYLAEDETEEAEEGSKGAKTKGD